MDGRKSDDMVRVTIDLKRTVWFGWKKLLVQKGMKVDKSEGVG